MQNHYQKTAQREWGYIIKETHKNKTLRKKDNLPKKEKKRKKDRNSKLQKKKKEKKKKKTVGAMEICEIERVLKSNTVTVVLIRQSRIWFLLLFYFFIFMFKLQQHSLNWTMVWNSNIFGYLIFNDGWDILNQDNTIILKFCIPSHKMGSHITCSTNMASFPFLDITFLPLKTFNKHLNRG